MASVARGMNQDALLKKPKFIGWSTSEEGEVLRRQWRGATEVEGFEPLEKGMGAFGSFKVASVRGWSYVVEIRDLEARQNSCSCMDFETAQLGTCKHIEGVLHLLRESNAKNQRFNGNVASPRIEVYPPLGSAGDLKIMVPSEEIPDSVLERVEERFSEFRYRCSEASLGALQQVADDHPGLVRVSRLCKNWGEKRFASMRRDAKRRAFIADEQSGRQTVEVLNFPLFPYQREGVRHLALGERCLLADEMGLGKTVQALGACKLLQKLEGVSRVLVVCPVSLKTEWAEQIETATDLSYNIIAGPRPNRLQNYSEPQFFTITNYEQILADLDDMQRLVKPDIVVLDEAQRIKNWRTKTAVAIKRLRSRYAFVLTGTPLENRIDELYSILQFLDPGLLGPLFRFNRDYYSLDERGRAVGYKNLDKLRERTRKVMLRRRKAEVETDLPERTNKNYFLEMTDEQDIRYVEYKRVVAMILGKARRRALFPAEFQRLQGALACMRMICDTPYILDPLVRDCPKLDELERVLDEILENENSKIIIFSEWVRMLELIREKLDEIGWDYAWHTGGVPQLQRRVEINRFKQDPACRIFLSSESGGVGLNLQVANAVINIDLPWNPAKLEQRIARAWRKHQERTVSVFNLVSQGTIEHRMLGLLEQKQAVADNVLDGMSDQDTMDLPSGRAAFIEQLETVMGMPAAAATSEPEPEPGTVLLERLRAAFGERLFAVELRKSDSGGKTVLAVVEGLEEADRSQPERDAKDLPLEHIDKESYETMLRLEAAGILPFSAAREDLLYQAEAEDKEAEAARRNQKFAIDLLEQADRRKKMAILLSGGGFAREAESESVNIANFALKAMAAAYGQEVNEENWGSEQVWNVCESMTGKGVFSTDQQYKAVWLCQTAPDQEAQTTLPNPTRLQSALELLSQADSVVREGVPACAAN